MAVSSDQIKGLIDSNLPDASDRRNKVNVVRSLLKIVVDWVRDAVNGSVTPWNKLGTGGLAESGADEVYRTGKVIVGRNSDDGSGAKLQVQGGVSANRFSVNCIPVINTDVDIAGSGWSSLHGNVGLKAPGNGLGLSLGWNYSGGQGETNIVYGVQGLPDNAFLGFYSWDGGVMSEKMRIAPNSHLGVGTTGPSARLHVNGSSGADQFRLEKSFTPANSADPAGQTGHVAWDANFMYVKTAGGWKRTALSTW